MDDQFRSLGGIEPVLGSDFSVLSEGQIIALENNIGSLLPLDYREFLKNYGGSRFGLLVLFRPLNALPETVSSFGNGCFDYFFGGGDDYSLTWARKSYEDRIPESLLPICGDLGGGVICLGLSDDTKYKIYYWDPKNEWDPDDIEEGEDIEVAKFKNVHHVADSFSAFLRQLEVSPHA